MDTSTHMPRARQALVKALPLLMLAGFLAAGLLSGTLIATYFKHRAEALELDRQKYRTAAALSKMESVTVGNALSIPLLTSLNGTERKLTDFVCGLTWISFVEPGCEACDQTIDRLSKAIPVDELHQHLVLVSAASHDVLSDFAALYAIESITLQDPDRRWVTSINLTTFPFFVLVDSSLTILEVVAGGISVEHFRESLGQ